LFLRRQLHHLGLQALQGRPIMPGAAGRLRTWSAIASRFSTTTPAFSPALPPTIARPRAQVGPGPRSLRRRTCSGRAPSGLARSPLRQPSEERVVPTVDHVHGALFHPPNPLRPRRQERAVVGDEV